MKGRFGERGERTLENECERDRTERVRNAKGEGRARDREKEGAKVSCERAIRKRARSMVTKNERE